MKHYDQEPNSYYKDNEVVSVGIFKTTVILICAIFFGMGIYYGTQNLSDYLKHSEVTNDVNKWKKCYDLQFDIEKYESCEGWEGDNVIHYLRIKNFKDPKGNTISSGRLKVYFDKYGTGTTCAELEGKKYGACARD